MPSSKQEELIRKEWLPALRSGKYEQARRALHLNGKYCCLGVLADISGAEWKRLNGADWFSFKDDDELYGLSEGEGAADPLELPRSVADRYGITSDGEFSPAYIVTGDDGVDVRYSSLASLNDGAEWSFYGIANFIEDHLLNPESPYTFLELWSQEEEFGDGYYCE